MSLAAWGYEEDKKCTQRLQRDSAAERLLHYHLTNKTVRSIRCALGVFLVRETCHLLKDTGGVTTPRHVAALCPSLGLCRTLRLLQPQGMFRVQPPQLLPATDPRKKGWALQSLALQITAVCGDPTTGFAFHGGHRVTLHERRRSTRHRRQTGKPSQVGLTKRKCCMLQASGK